MQIFILNHENEVNFLRNHNIKQNINDKRQSFSIATISYFKLSRSTLVDADLPKTTRFECFVHS